MVSYLHHILAELTCVYRERHPPRGSRRYVRELAAPKTRAGMKRQFDRNDVRLDVRLGYPAGAAVRAMSASLIGRLGSSAFRLSTTAVSMSLTGSRFSSESAPRPFHHGIRGRGGAISYAALPSDERRSKRTHEFTSSIVPRGTSFHRSVELEFPPIGFDLAGSCGCSFPGPPELGAVNPDAVHDHGQSARQGHDCFFHPAPPGDLHRPGLEP